MMGEIYKTQNGWTVEKMKARVYEKNNGKPSVDEDGSSCLYRGPDGNQCGVGCFIDDEDYKKEIENRTPYRLPRNIIAKFPINVIGMAKMQDAHDAFSWPEHAGKDMREILCEWIDKNVVNG